MKEVTVPDLGSAGDVTVIEVLVQAGDKIEADTPIVTLESDKATMEVPTTFAGIVKEIKVKTGAKVASGSVLLTLEEAVTTDQKSEEKSNSNAIDPKDAKDAKGAKADKKSEKKDQTNLSSTAPQSVAETAVQLQQAQSSTEQEAIHAGPGVRRLARELNIDLSAITGSGPKNRILKEDIQNFIKQGFGNSGVFAGIQPELIAVDHIGDQRTGK